MNPPLEAWYLGIDLGTGSCKCAVVGPDGTPVAMGSGRYPPGRYGASGEQDPESYWQGMVAAVRAAAAGLIPQNCRGISIGGALHGLLPIDGAGQPLGGAMNWADSRPAGVVRELRASGKAAGLYARTGCPPHWLYPLYKMRWMRQEQPERFLAASRFATLKELFLQRLTGLQGPYRTDWTSAGGSGLLDVRRLQWDEEALSLAGVETGQLSRPVSPLDRVGELTEQAAALLGLAAGTPVVMGSADATNSSLGAGALQAGQLTCMIGTSGALRTFLPEPPDDPSGRVWCYPVAERLYLAGGAINNGGLALTWLRDVLLSAGADLSFDRLLQLAEKSPPGANGVVCLPLFAGERGPNWSLDASGCFFGLTVEHDAAHLARAVVEGVAYRLRSLQDMLEQAGVAVCEVRASGGFSHSAFWLQLISSVLGRPLSVPVWEETSSLGAAWWPLLADRPEQGLEVLTGTAKVAQTILPAPEDTEQYRLLYRRYERLYETMLPFFNQPGGTGGLS